MYTIQKTRSRYEHTMHSYYYNTYFEYHGHIMNSGTRSWRGFTVLKYLWFLICIHEYDSEVEHERFFKLISKHYDDEDNTIIRILCLNQTRIMLNSPYLNKKLWNINQTYSMYCMCRVEWYITWTVIGITYTVVTALSRGQCYISCILFEQNKVMYFYKIYFLQNKIRKL